MRPSERSKGPVRRGDKQRLIRQAAFRCFNERGYDQTTVDDICRTAGVSKGSLYWHFKSKQEVFLSILETWAEEVEAQLERRFEDVVDAPDPMSAVARALMVEARRAQLIMPVWLDFLARAHREPEVRSALADFHRRIRLAIAGLLRPFFEERFDERELNATAGTLLAAYVGLVGQSLADPENSGFDEQFNAFVPILRFYVAQTQAK